MKLRLLALFSLLSLPCIASAAEEVVAAPGSLTRAVLSLVVVVGFMIGAAVLFKKLGLNRMQSGLPIKIIGATSLGNTQRIVIIEIGEEWIVLGVTPHNISTITTMPRQEEGNSPAPIDQSHLPTWLKRALGKSSVNNV